MRRALRRAVGLAALTTVALVGWRAVQVIAIGVAYRAKIACSGVFVSQHDPAAAIAETESDDLAILRHIRVSVDVPGRAVEATALGLVRRRAVFRDGLGCALVLDGLIPPASHESITAGPQSRFRLMPFTPLDTRPQFVTIVPSRKAVIVRLGRTRHPQSWDHCAFVTDVLAALPPG